MLLCILFADVHAQPLGLRRHQKQPKFWSSIPPRPMQGVWLQECLSPSPTEQSSMIPWHVTRTGSNSLITRRTGGLLSGAAGQPGSREPRLPHVLHPRHRAGLPQGHYAKEETGQQFPGRGVVSFPCQVPQVPSSSSRTSEASATVN